MEPYKTCQYCQKQVDQFDLIEHTDICQKKYTSPNLNNFQIQQQQQYQMEQNLISYPNDQQQVNNNIDDNYYICQNCNEKIEIEMIEEHQDYCLQQCEYCNDEFPQILMQDHYQQCKVKKQQQNDIDQDIANRKKMEQQLRIQYQERERQQRMELYEAQQLQRQQNNLNQKLGISENRQNQLEQQNQQIVQLQQQVIDSQQSNNNNDINNLNNRDNQQQIQQNFQHSQSTFKRQINIIKQNMNNIFGGKFFSNVSNQSINREHTQQQIQKHQQNQQQQQKFKKNNNKNNSDKATVIQRTINGPNGGNIIITSSGGTQEQINQQFTENQTRQLEQINRMHQLIQERLLYGNNELNQDENQQQQGLNEEEINSFPVSIFQESDLEQNNNNCIICMSEFEQGDETKFLDCYHRYHKDCIDKWLLSNITCPVCKQSCRH